MSKRPETPEEIKYRLHSERECRRIADLIKAELPESRAFILLTADIGPGHSKTTFQSTAYVSSIRRGDAAKLMMELVGHWLDSGTLPRDDDDG